MRKVYFCLVFIAFITVQCNSNKNYSINHHDNEYEISLYNNKGDKILSESYPIEPDILRVNKDIIEIILSTGSPSRNVYFFNQENSKMSRVFFNPIIFGISHL